MSRRHRKALRRESFDRYCEEAIGWLGHAVLARQAENGTLPRGPSVELDLGDSPPGAAAPPATPPRRRR